jgi:hypothetical protein
MKKLLFTIVTVALIGSAGMFFSCSKSNEDDDDKGKEWVYNPAEDGIIGEWYSSGANVALLLMAYNDSLYAKFNADGTYLVEQYKDGIKGADLVGIYTQEKSGVGNIWTISTEITSSAGAGTISEGIFEITKVGNGYTMQYEVVQLGIGFAPPTPEGGFGSTGGLGSLGLPTTANIQKYVRIEK